MDPLPNVDTRNYGSPTLRFEDDGVEDDARKKDSPCRKLFLQWICVRILGRS